MTPGLGGALGWTRQVARAGRPVKVTFVNRPLSMGGIVSEFADTAKPIGAEVDQWTVKCSTMVSRSTRYLSSSG